jgi:hypothetical protein
MSELIVRTDLSELIVRTDLSELNLMIRPWYELIHLVLLLCFLSVYSCTTLSHIYLSTTNVEHLDSITFSDMLKLISARREFTSCCSFLARLRVIGP